jgi:mono/diheme cytochrome c family protein
MRFIFCLAASMTFVTVPSPAESPPVRRGKAIVATKCAACHAIGITGASRHPKAPAFRSLSARYPIEHLAEALAEGIATGHPDMPEFTFPPSDVEALIAYMKSLGSSRH